MLAKNKIDYLVRDFSKTWLQKHFEKTNFCNIYNSVYLQG